MKVGVVIGKFYPFHKGHAHMITEATKYVDKLFIMPCFTDGETMPINIRTQCIQNWLDEQRGVDCNVVIEPITEKLPASEDSRTSDYEVSKVWAEWLKKKHPNITHFIGSEPYVKMMADSIGADFVLIDVKREAIPVSATMIRNDFETNKTLLATDMCRETYVKRICFVGAESSGKTTLIRELARKYQVPFVEEYGRTYCEVNSPIEDGKDYFLTRRDFHNIAIGHNRLVLKAYEKALAVKKDFILVDTDHVITQVFYKRYLDSNGDRKLQDMINFQHYDLYIWLDPVEFENDGTRRLVSEEVRLKQVKDIKNEFEKNGITLHTIGVHGAQLTLEQRISEIDKLFKYHNIIPKESV